MRPVTIICHIAAEGPGYLETVLQRYHIDYQIVAIDQQQPIPESIEGMSGLIIMGGSMSVNDSDSWISQEIQLIQLAIENNLPVLGHCLGGQFIARALGAEVVQNPVKEIGWLPVHNSNPNNNQNNPNIPDWLDNFSTPQIVFHWHGETFKLPDNSIPLLSSQHCKNQAFLYKKNVLAFQCHIEMTSAMVKEWGTLYEDELAIPSNTIQSQQEMIQGCEQHINNLNRLADSVYQHWLGQLGA